MNPTGAPRCARHLESPTSFTCPRCGAFGCVDCERRPSLDAAPMCPACWALTAQTKTPDSGALQTAGLIVGVIGIVPCCPLALASLALNTVALVKSTRENRWKPIVGICVTLVGTLLQVLLVALPQMVSKR